MASSSTQGHIESLLASLAVGVKSASKLPSADLHSFASSFPDFSSLSTTARDHVTALLEGLTDEQLDDGDVQEWENVADVIEKLLSQASLALHPGSSDGSLNSTQLSSPSSLSSLSSLSATASAVRATARSKLSQLTSNIAIGLPKSQATYGFEAVDNDRTTPFVPAIKEKHHAVSKLSLEPVFGHGIADVESDDPAVIAPSTHHEHPYSDEINSVVFQPNHLAPPPNLPRTGLGNTLFPVDTIDRRTKYIRAEGALVVETKSELEALAERLAGAKEIAVDLEHHSYRTFAGFTCLIQISVRPHPNPSTERERTNDFLVDALKLRSSIGPVLAPIFANPAVVKVMHGANSDIVWLQRDFSIYVVNLFDTYHAAVVLNLEAKSLKHLLNVYAGYDANKELQLSDWRVRPLTKELISYARGDTHFLLDVYDALRAQLSNGGSMEDGSAITVKRVFEDSKGVCLRRYDKEPFKKHGYKALLRNDKPLTPRQESCLAKLWEWRDSVAREHDESCNYVLTNQGIMRVVAVMPTKMQGLVSLFNPVPVLLADEKDTVMAIIAECAEDGGASTDAGSSAATTTGKPPRNPINISVSETSQLNASASPFSYAPSGSTPPAPSRTIMSPVLGTEALYKTAGWLSSPASSLTNPNTRTLDSASPDDDELDDDKAGDEVKLNYNNYGAVTSNFSEHSILRAGIVVGENKKVIKKVIDDGSFARVGVKTINDSSLPPAAPAPTSNDAASDKPDRSVMTASPVPNAADIPKSMSEIYVISNRNRRKKKGGDAEIDDEREGEGIADTSMESAGSGDAVEERCEGESLDGGATGGMDDSELSNAEKLLGGIGAEGYFGDRGTKRQKLEPWSGKEDDVQMMRDVGWIADDEDVSTMLGAAGDKSGEGASAEGVDKDGDETKDVDDKGSKSDTKNRRRGRHKEHKEERKLYEQQKQQQMQQQVFAGYGNMDMVGAFSGSAMASNPFFAGSANAEPTRVTNQKLIQQQQNKKANSAPRGSHGKEKLVERPERTMEKSYVTSSKR
jgi:ribonuclease D